LPGSSDKSQPKPSVCRRFLVPIDFSDASLKALRYARQLAAGAKAALTLLNVIEEPLSFRNLDLARQQRQRKGERLAKLESLARREVGPGIPLNTLVCDGSPVEEITRLAASIGSDMIIVGRHAHRGLRRWFHGHTALRLVGRAACPVVVLGD
jgi:universal stress protein A